MSVASRARSRAARPAHAGGTPRPLALRSPLLLRWFSWVARRELGRSFHAVRLLRGDLRVEPGPLLVVLNHPSWWDPLVSLVLSQRLAGRAHVAPMDARELARFRFFERLGVFGIAPEGFAGARELSTVGRAVLARPDAALWVTAQGRFADARERPARLRPGVGHLARALEGATVLPLALEYVPWSERLPEALAAFGEPIRVMDGRSLSAGEWLARIERALERTQDDLALAARARDPAPFETLVEGGSGLGGFYGLWQRARGHLRPSRP